jgi:thiamine pyrophosphokinase
MKRVVIFVNGQVGNIESVRSLILPGDSLLAADGGAHHALSLGLMPSKIIGDLDSLSEQDFKRCQAAGCEFLQHPRDKNETDFELALHLAVESGFREILVVGALGGRLDQTLANLSLLTDPSLAGLEIKMDDGIEEAWFIRNSSEIRGAPSDTISLIPWGGSVTGIQTTGLRWPLDDEILFADKTRGISNELTTEKGYISIKTGFLLIVHRRNP